MPRPSTVPMARPAATPPRRCASAGWVMLAPSPSRRARVRSAWVIFRVMAISSSISGSRPLGATGRPPRPKREARQAIVVQARKRRAGWHRRGARNASPVAAPVVATGRGVVAAGVVVDHVEVARADGAMVVVDVEVAGRGVDVMVDEHLVAAATATPFAGRRRLAVADSPAWPQRQPCTSQRASIELLGHNVVPQGKPVLAKERLSRSPRQATRGRNGCARNQPPPRRDKGRRLEAESEDR